MRSTTSALKAVCTVAAALLAAGAAYAGATPCTGLLSGVIDGDVSAGAGCYLSNALVNGNVKVDPGGSLLIGSSVIAGNLHSTQATEIWVVAGSSIGGDVHIDDTSGSYRVALTDLTVEGSVEIEKNGALILMSSLDVGGNIQVHGNTFTGAGNGLFIPYTVRLSSSTVSGNVEMYDNSSTANFAEGNIIVVELNWIDGNLEFHDNLASNGNDWLVTVMNSVGGNLKFHHNSSRLYLSVGGNTVGDTIQVTDNTALQGTVSVVSNTAGGNLEFGNNSTTNGLGVDRNVVGGHLKVHNNTATDLDASLDVSGNAVTKSLNCRNDNPAAVALYGLNTAAKKLGECAGL